MLRGVELHSKSARFESAVSQEILDELLQALSALAHVLQDFALAIADRPQLLAVKQFDVSVQNRKRRLQIVSCRTERVRRAMQSLAEFLVFVQQVLRAGHIRVDGQGRRR